MPVAILDFYVDEPTCLGVPPFLSPYSRYIAGALRAGGLDWEEIDYIHIDSLRDNGFSLSKEYDALFIFGGSTVPGKYLATRIGTIAELLQLFQNIRYQKSPIFLGGPFSLARIWQQETINHQNIHICPGDLEKIAYNWTKTREIPDALELRARRSNHEVSHWSLLGAQISRQARFYPHIIAEIETYRGCPRNQFCSFCTEKLYGSVHFREIADIHREVSALIEVGIFFFRLGRQADILAYQSRLEIFQSSFPKPEPKAVIDLYRAISSTPGIQLLHLDNVNPGTIAHFPMESREILTAIASMNSPGDTAALGIESVDPEVIAANRLKVDSVQAMEVVHLINQCGGHRREGLPALLPGINLIHGLKAEREGTFEMNYRFLKQVLEEGVLLRRINIRQVVTHQDTELAEAGMASKINTRLRNRFLYFKQKIREEIDTPMLKLVFPAGTILRNVLIEKLENGYTLGRPLSSYPITCKIFADLEIYQKYDLCIIDHEQRSLVGIPIPIYINSISSGSISRLPGIGKKRKERWLFLRPFLRLEDFLQGVEPGKESNAWITHAVF